MSPLVSVIMPCYNCESYIRETIDSVLAQTYTNWELIIVDDCSTDNTAKIIASYQDERIHYKRNTQNLRAALTRNEALKVAKGKYIAFLDSDDLWLPEKLEKQIAFMQKHNYAMTYSPYYVISSDGTYMYTHIGPTHINYYQMSRWDRIGCLTVIYDTSQLGVIMMPKILNREDYAYWLVILRKGITAYRYNQPLAIYRSHNGMSKGNKFSLLKYHYQLFNTTLGYAAPIACLLTIRNSIFYILYHFIDNKKTNENINNWLK